MTAQRRPGDFILDRYVPGLAAQEREKAREHLYRFVAWQMRIIARQLRERAVDSPGLRERGILDNASTKS